MFAVDLDIGDIVLEDGGDIDLSNHLSAPRCQRLRYPFVLWPGPVEGEVDDCCDVEPQDSRSSNDAGISHLWEGTLREDAAGEDMLVC